MLNDPSFAESVSSSISEVRRWAPDAALRMVANVKSSPVESGDYAETSVTIEHFSATELGVLLDGFRQNGFFVTFHDGEVEFIKQDLRRGSEEDHILEVVYNTAQSGVGGGRKSLVPAYCAIRGIRICNSDRIAGDSRELWPGACERQKRRSRFGFTKMRT